MVLPGCPAWQYDAVPKLREAVLQSQTFTFLNSLRRRACTFENTVLDTRSTHVAFFSRLTPAGFEYYAGHYRGSRDCLIDYEVSVGGAPQSVGWPAKSVDSAMRIFAREVAATMSGLDHGWILPAAQMPEHEKLKYLVAVAARAFVRFLDIHPYADGNGHIARAIVWTVLARFDYFPISWPIEPRPDEPYVRLIDQHREGNPSPLEVHILRQLT